MINNDLNELYKERDLRPRKDFWAPGHYYCSCVTCKKQFVGDKRAVNCSDCAYSNIDEEKDKEEN